MRHGPGLERVRRRSPVRAHDDSGPARSSGCAARLGDLRRREHEALLGRGRRPRARRAHDAPDEDVQKDEEGDLQRRRSAVSTDTRPLTKPRSNTSSVVPSSDGVAVLELRPLDALPVDRRSRSWSRDRRSSRPRPRCRISACRRETLGSSTGTSLSRDRPSTSARFVELVALSPRTSAADSGPGQRGSSLGGRPRCPRRRLEDLVWARRGLRHELRRRGAASLRLHHPRGDAELADGRSSSSSMSTTGGESSA